MLDKLKQYLNGEVEIETLAGQGPNEEDLRIACGVLLLEMAGRDEDFAPEEVKAVFREMQAQFDMSEQEVLALLKKSEEQRDSEQKIDLFVNKINQNYSTEQRSTILRMAWNVVLADGEVEKAETKFINQLAARLKLDQEVAKKLIEESSHIA